jgi:hypothetical protein
MKVVNIREIELFKHLNEISVLNRRNLLAISIGNQVAFVNPISMVEIKRISF